MNRITKHLLLLAACLFAVLLVSAAGATPGGLDSTFGTGGKVATAVGSGNAYGNGLVRQPDGKLVVAGSSYNGLDGDFALARYNPDGKLDTTFNGTGKVTTAMGPSWDSAWALARQPDGKLVAAGGSNNGSNEDFAIARYNPNGSLDTSFNGTGKVTTPIGSGNDDAYAVAVQPDGKLVAAGKSWNGSQFLFTLARYNPNGKLDTTFNGTGKVTTAIGSQQDVAYALALQPDGKIIAAGSSYNVKDAFAIARYNPNGSLDTTFNGTGKVTTAVGSYDDVNALALQPDGKIVAAGASISGADFRIALARYNPDGKLDTGFNGTGKVTTAIGSGDSDATDLVLQPDGKLVTAGYSYAGSARVFTLTRYNPNGSLDTTFNGSGKVTTAVGSDDEAYGLVLQPDGKLVAAGVGHKGSQAVFALVRYSGSALTVSKTGSGSGTVGSSPNGINCGTTCSAPFAAVPVTLTATPSAGSSFLGWSGACSGTGPCKVTMGADQTVTARFETPKALTLTKAGRGTGTVTSSPAGISCGSTCALSFAYGTPVTLTASPAPGSAFAGWAGDCSGTGTCTLTMSANHSATATFKQLCIVPKLKGKTLKAAKKAIKRAHCSVGKMSKAFSAKVKKGHVISQKPKAGKKLAAGSKVKFKLSKGKKASR